MFRTQIRFAFEEVINNLDLIAEMREAAKSEYDYQLVEEMTQKTSKLIKLKSELMERQRKHIDSLKGDCGEIRDCCRIPSFLGSPSDEIKKLLSERKEDINKTYKIKTATEPIKLAENE